jgi:hypothetical protein
MREKRDRSPCLIMLLVAAFVAAAVISAGCGEGTNDSYQQAVLDGWSGLQVSSEKLAEATNKSLDDLEGFSGELANAREEIASFEGELNDLKVPGNFAASQEALEDFLSAYDEYLVAMENMLNLFLAGKDLSSLPTIAPQLERAEQSLQDYRDSQEYNGAQLDRDVWDVLHILDEAIGSAIIVDTPQDKTTANKYSKALETVDAWYKFFNTGDGESMYALLDLESPIKNNYSRQFFLAQVGEAYEGGLRATHHVIDAELSTDTGGDWYTAFLTVDYTATMDMEGNPVPPSSEDIQLRLINRGNGWYFYDIQNSSRIY